MSRSDHQRSMLACLYTRKKQTNGRRGKTPVHAPECVLPTPIPDQLALLRGSHALNWHAPFLHPSSFASGVTLIRALHR